MALHKAMQYAKILAPARRPIPMPDNISVNKFSHNPGHVKKKY